ncbi:hypothetical protein LP419_02980 [Massilia sp. H-1]|nr:hypothetical protein LP419_02980 [Massilia sp. H-1]
MLAARAWRLAFWWSVLFGLAVALVGASKIVFMGWGGGWPSHLLQGLQRTRGRGQRDRAHAVLCRAVQPGLG